tara:strand:- start:286 stop:426 length:141 start_codon:yes stop_codon:yes gene_type:complete
MKIRTGSINPSSKEGNDRAQDDEQASTIQEKQTDLIISTTFFMTTS